MTVKTIPVVADASTICLIEFISLVVEPKIRTINPIKAIENIWAVHVPNTAIKGGISLVLFIRTRLVTTDIEHANKKMVMSSSGFVWESIDLIDWGRRSITADRIYVTRKAYKIMYENTPLKDTDFNHGFRIVKTTSPKLASAIVTDIEKLIKNLTI